jgi:hypothetical protein
VCRPAVSPTTMQNRELLQQTPRRQFSLAGLLSYVLAASVYFAMIASVRPLLAETPGSPGWWPAAATIPTAWCVLWALYRLWRLPQVLSVHYAGPIMVLCFLLLAAAVVLFMWVTQFSLRNPSLMACLEFAGGGLLIGCGLSTAASLPAATLMLLYLCTRPVRTDDH